MSVSQYVKIQYIISISTISKYLTLSETRKRSELAFNAQKHDQNDENEEQNVVEYTKIIGMRWIDKHGNQWLIDSEGVPKSQNIEITKNDDDQQQQEQHQVIVSGHSMIYILWSTLTLKAQRTEYPLTDQR